MTEIFDELAEHPAEKLVGERWWERITAQTIANALQVLETKDTPDAERIVVADVHSAPRWIVERAKNVHPEWAIWTPDAKDFT